MLNTAAAPVGLAEYGIVIPKGFASLRRALPAMVEDREGELSGLMRELIAWSYPASVDGIGLAVKFCCC